MKESRYAEELRMTRKFLQNPDLWPQYPILPLTCRNGNDKNLGFVLASNRRKVYFGNMYMLGDRPLENYDSFTFETVEELIAAGWRID